MVYDHTPCSLAVIRLFVRVRQRLESATHPALAEVFQQCVPILDQEYFLFD
jgi:hypothetical protein